MRKNSCFSSKLWRTVLRQSTCYPAPRLSLSHLRSDLKSGLSAECEVLLRSKTRRHVYWRKTRKVRKIVFLIYLPTCSNNYKLILFTPRLFPHPQLLLAIISAIDSFKDSSCFLLISTLLLSFVFGIALSSISDFLANSFKISSSLYKI